MAGILTPQSQIDAVGPINWMSPHSRALHGAWFCLPGRMSGSAIPNLTREHGSSMNLVAQPGFAGIVPPGGSGSVRFNGSTQYGRAPFAHPSSAEWTISGWVNITSVSSNGYVALLGASGTNNVGIASNNAAGKFSAVWNTTVTISGAYTWTAGVWYYLTLAINNAGGNLYVNGLSVGSSSTAAGAFIPGQFDLAAQTNISSPQVAGSFADWIVINRRLKSLEVELLYLEAQLGYPQLLRRIAVPQLYSASTGNRRRRVLCAGKI